MVERNRIAETLRKAREKQGLSLEQAATAAGIPLQYLRLLEGESNVRVGVADELYLIPFFRKYARFVGMDAEALLPEFLGAVQQLPGEGSPPIRLAYRTRGAFLWKPIAVVLTIGVAVVLMLRQGPERPTFEDQASGANGDEGSATTGETSPPVAQSAPLIPSPASTGITTPIPGGAPPSTAASVETTPDPGLAAAPGVVATETHALNIAAIEEAWLSLAVDDQPAKPYLLRAGESRSWNAVERFTLTVGNAGGITLALDGRALPAIGLRGQVVRNLRLPAAFPSPSPTAH